MATETQAQAMGEMLSWLEQQIRAAREEQLRANAQLDQLRQQVYDLSEQSDIADRTLREVDPKFVPFKGLPEKIRALDEGHEHVRQQISANKAEIDNALRLLRAEADYDRKERSDAFRRIEHAAGQLGLITADISQVQSQTAQVAQTAAALIERQREVENRVQQFGLRLDRAIEVNRDLEERVKEVVLTDLDDRFEVVYERVQVVGEMIRRADAMIDEASRQQTLKTDVLDEVAVWREQHTRMEARLSIIEEIADRVLTDVDKLRGEVALLEGRHAGLGERVAGIRKDIAEVVDHVRDEFAKFNGMTEKQRRKQIQVLEQELREMKFHSFRPPEEP